MEQREERVMPDGLSPSSIELWRQCPKRFEQEKVLGFRSPGGVDSVIGTFVHLVLELLMERPAAGRTLDAAKEILRAEWPGVSHDDDWPTLGIAPGSPEERDFKRRAWAGVRGYFEIENPQRVEVIARERYLSAVCNGVPLRGIIDRLDRDVFDDVVVSDYKTGKVPIPAFRGPKFRQLNLYAAMVEQTDGVRPNEGRLLFTTHARTLATTIDAESVADAVQTARDAWDELHASEERDEYEATPGPLCGWCPFVIDCAAGLAEVRERRKAGKLKSHAPAWELAGTEGDIG
jgi:putative RecB family exonuclease